MSQTQRNANRENARKSCGPTTTTGKSASSRNAMTHGLTAQSNIFPDGETPALFLALLDDLAARFNPMGELEYALVKRMADQQWRLDRVFSLEAGMLRVRAAQMKRADAQEIADYPRKKEHHEFSTPLYKAASKLEPLVEYREGDLLGRVFAADADKANALTKLTRYETTLERSLDRTMKRLEYIQEIRAKAEAAQAAAPAPTQPEQPRQPQQPDPEPVTPNESNNCKTNPNPEPNGSPYFAEPPAFIRDWSTVPPTMIPNVDTRRKKTYEEN